MCDCDMVEAVIVRVVRACCRYPRLTVVMASLITFGAGIYSYDNFAIHTDTGQLISSRLPWRQRELQLDAAFPQLVDTILVVLDGATPELARDGASRLAAKLAGDRANFQAVQEAEGGAFFEKNGLLFLPPEDVRSTTEQLIRAQAFLGTLAADPSLHGLAEALALIPKGVEAGSIELKNFDKPLTVLSSTVDALLQERPAAFSWAELMTGKSPTKSEFRRFIRVQPKLDFEALQPGAAASDKIRTTAAALGLTPEKGISVRLTGSVAMADEEFSTLAEGALLNTLLTAGAVLLFSGLHYAQSAWSSPSLSACSWASPLPRHSGLHWWARSTRSRWPLPSCLSASASTSGSRLRCVTAASGTSIITLHRPSMRQPTQLQSRWRLPPPRLPQASTASYPPTIAACRSSV